VLASPLPRSKIGIVALEFFPVIGQDVSERHLRTESACESACVIGASQRGCREVDGAEKPSRSWARRHPSFRAAHNKQGTRCVNPDGSDNRGLDVVAGVHTNRYDVRMHQAGVPQNLSGSITGRDGCADPRSSRHVSRECKQLRKRAFRIRFRRGNGCALDIWKNVK
jgi:hypothetical protein